MPQLTTDEMYEQCVQALAGLDIPKGVTVRLQHRQGVTDPPGDGLLLPGVSYDHLAYSIDRFHDGKVTGFTRLLGWYDLFSIRAEPVSALGRWIWNDITMIDKMIEERKRG